MKKKFPVGIPTSAEETTGRSYVVLNKKMERERDLESQGKIKDFFPEKMNSNPAKKKKP